MMTGQLRVRIPASPPTPRATDWLQLQSFGWGCRFLERILNFSDSLRFSIGTMAGQPFPILSTTKQKCDRLQFAVRGNIPEVEMFHDISRRVVMHTTVSCLLHVHQQLGITCPNSSHTLTPRRNGVARCEKSPASLSTASETHLLHQLCCDPGHRAPRRRDLQHFHWR